MTDPRRHYDAAGLEGRGAGTQPPRAGRQPGPDPARLPGRIFGPGRAELLAAQLPATDADAAAERDAQVARLQARIKRIETAQNSQILELEDLPADPADTAAAAMRARIRARFADLHHEREQFEAQLQALAKTTP